MSKLLTSSLTRGAWVLFVWVLMAGLAKAQPRAFFGSGKHGSLTINSSAAILNTDDTRAAITGISNIGSRMLLTLDGAHFYGTFDTSDWVIIIEMEGDSVGNYVYAQVDSMSGTSLYTRTTFTRVAYSTGERIQVIKVSEYYDLRIFGGVMTCHPYDGYTGGILAVFVQNDFELNYDGLIDLVNKGYPGALGGVGGAGASPAGIGGQPGGSPGEIGGNATGSSTGFNGITGWAVCTDDPMRTTMLGGRGGIGTNQVAATSLPGAGSDAIQYPFSDFIQKRLVMGRGGNGGDGGMGANAGGNGGSGGNGTGAGTGQGQQGQLGGSGAPGGNGGNGGTGGGAMYLRAYNVEAKTKPSLGTGLLEARIIGYGNLGQNGGTGGRGGEAGNGGDGGTGGTLLGSEFSVVGPGGGGGPGIRGNGGDGGQGGQTGMGATVWIVYGNDYNTFEPYWQVNNSTVSSPGFGGDIATNPGAYGNRPVFDLSNIPTFGNLWDPTGDTGYMYCSVGTIVTERCDGWEAFCRFGKMDSIVVLTGNRYQFYLKSDTSSKCFYQKSTHTLQCTTKFVYPDAPTHPGYTWYDIAECKLEPNSSCDSLMQRLIDSAGKPGTFGQCDTFPYNVRFRDSIIFYSGAGFIDSIVRAVTPQFVCYNLLCESDSVDLGCMVSECVRIGNPGPVADAGIAGIVVRQQELPSGKKTTNVLEETEDNVGIRLYPNPTNGKLFLQFEAEAPQGDYEVSLYDVSGKMIEIERLNLTAVSRNFTLHYEELQLKGTYFVVISGQGRTTTKKILFDN